LAGKLNNYGFGKTGVVVDKSQPFLSDTDLTKAQNAIRDPLGSDGGLKNRPPHIKFNSGAAAGTILGGIGVPLLKAVTRTLYIGRAQLSGGLGLPLGWWSSTAAFASTATVISSGVPGNPRGYEIADFAGGALSTLGGSPGIGVMVNGKLYYGSGGYVVYPTASSAAPTVRIFDGVTDSEWCRIPPNPDVAAGTNAKGIMSMLVANGTIYLSTFDGGTTSADYRGRVFSLNPNTGQLFPLGGTFTVGHLPYALAFAGGRVWVGTHTGDLTMNGKIYSWRVGVSTAWTLDKTGSNGNYCSLATCFGNIYAGTMQAAGTFAKVEQRDSLGAWTTPETGTGGTSRDANAYLQLRVFQGNLYATYWNNDTTPVGTIRKYNGTAWSTAYSGTAATRGPFLMVAEDNSLLYVGSGGLGLAGTLIRTPDGTTWTDLTAASIGVSTYTIVPAFASILS